MKKKITISYSLKRTFNLGDYENAVPLHSVTEELELDEGEVFTDEQYSERFKELKSIVWQGLKFDASFMKKKK